MSRQNILNNIFKIFGCISFAIIFIQVMEVEGKLRVKQEGAVVKYSNPAYISGVQVFTVRKKRNEPYLTNITATIHTTFGNNVTVKVSYLLPSGNAIDFSIRTCDAVDKPWMYEFAKTYSNLTECPVKSMMGKVKTQGLVSDLMPNIKLMQMSGHFLFNYIDETGGMSLLLRKAYASMHAFLIVINFVCLGINMARYADEVNELTANTITVLFFAHTIIKLAFFAFNSKSFYRTLAVWNQSNSHPLFTESDARYHQLSLDKSRRLLYMICGASCLSVVSWVTLTFFGDSVYLIADKETNETLTEPAPRLPLKAWYPFNTMSGAMYIVAFVYQIYWLLFSMLIANLMDVMFCCWLIFACEQLQHLKAIMKPLMELSAALDTYRPNTAELFRASSTEKSEKVPEPTTDMDIRGIYSTQQDFGMMLRGAGGRLQNFNSQNPNPNGLTQKQEMLARSAIKYWVERHKHVVRLVASIGDTYGTALLFHMLVSTITLTLLAYQATKIDGLNVYAFSTIGYLVYTLGQVFHFCIFGNRLIEESSSVMEAAYSCQWYDGSEEAKTFVQIVCQQCQKAMSISGAKFFTVSLDLFASVLGAVVTYFMVLVQLK